MSTMVRATAPYISFLCSSILLTLSVQAPTNDGSLNVVVETWVFPNGTVQINPSIGIATVDPALSITVTTDNEYTTSPGKKATISCNIESSENMNYIKTYWFKLVAFKNSHEWTMQSSANQLETVNDINNSYIMSMKVRIRNANTQYKCRACVTEFPASTYKRSFSGGEACDEKTINISRGRG